MRTPVLATILALLCWHPAEAQTSFHAFPQLADGRFSDGTFYRTTLNVKPFLQAATCTFVLRGGMTADFGSGIVSELSMSVPEEGFASVRTTGTPSFSSGYGTLTCSTLVYADAVYSFHAASGAKLAEATVFGSSESFRREIISDGRDGARLAIAISNNTDIVRTYDLTLRSSSGTTVSTGTVQVPSRSSLARFADELMSVPAGQVHILRIQAPDFSDLAAVGLRFTGGVFTTVPAN